MSAKFLPAFLVVMTLACQAFALTDATQFNSQSLNSGSPLHFTENKGQWDDRVLFKADGAGGLTWFIERDGFTVLQTVYEPSVDQGSLIIPTQVGIHSDPFQSTQSAVPSKSHALKFKFQNALPRSAGSFLPEQTTPAIASSIESTERLSWNNNYFLGNDQSKWAPDCGNFQKLALTDVWPGVDVVWKGAGDAVEFDFIVHPCASPSLIRVECLGLTGDLEATADGRELLLPTSLGVLRQALPEAFQIEEDGSLTTVQAEFRVEGSKSFGVVLPEGWDKSKKLVVDPLVYSTYLGGNGDDDATALFSDGAGEVIVAGYTDSNNFPTTHGAFDESFNGGGDDPNNFIVAGDVFVARLSRDGNELFYCTYLGGSGNEYARAITSDNAGGVVVAGSTTSDNFATTDGVFDESYNGSVGGYAFGSGDAFVARLSADGSELIYSTYLGGGRADVVFGIAPDGGGRVVMTGFTGSNDFPTTEGVLDRSLNGTSDAFVSQLSADGSELLYSTFLGGDSYEGAYAIVGDGAGGVIVTGVNLSGEFPTTEGVYDRSYNGGSFDAFVSRLSSGGNELVYSTYLGGGNHDEPYTLAPDGAGGIIVAGRTYSNDFPTTDGVFDRSYNNDPSAFVIRLSGDGSELIYSTYVGGGNGDYAYALASDGTGGAIVAGMTYGTDLSTTEDAFDRSYNGGTDVFIVWLSGDGSELLYGTYLGGGGNWDIPRAISLDRAGGVVVAGMTGSNDFPTTEGAFDRSYNGGSSDPFVARLDIGLPVLNWTEYPTEAIQATESDDVSFDVQGYHIYNPDANLSLTFSSPDLPEAAAFEDHGDGSGTFNWLPDFGDAGEYTAHFVLSNDEHEISAVVPIEVKELFHIPLRQGWNLVSSAVPPASPVIRSIWRNIVSRGNLILSKDQSGRFYNPNIGQNGFNNMERWDARQGYLAKLSQADTLIFVNIAVPEDTPIPLRQGWNIAAYFPEDNLDVRDAIASILDDLIMVKDMNGRFFRPAMGFSNMPPLSRGNGYQVAVSQSVELVYPAGGEMQNAELYAQDEAAPEHFKQPEPSGSSMSVVVTYSGVASGEIGAFTKSGLSVGAAVLQANEMSGMAIWGDDPTTDIVDGVIEGAAVSFRFWNGVEEKEAKVTWIEGDGTYATDGFGQIRIDGLAAVTPTEFALEEPYPNPFNSITTIRYSLPEASSIKLSIYELSGREIATLATGNRLAGVHNAAWNAEGVGSGLYFVRLEAGMKTFTQKVMLVK